MQQVVDDSDGSNYRHCIIQSKTFWSHLDRIDISMKTRCSVVYSLYLQLLYWYIHPVVSSSALECQLSYLLVNYFLTPTIIALEDHSLKKGIRVKTLIHIVSQFVQKIIRRFE